MADASLWFAAIVVGLTLAHQIILELARARQSALPAGRRKAVMRAVRRQRLAGPAMAVLAVVPVWILPEAALKAAYRMSYWVSALYPSLGFGVPPEIQAVAGFWGFVWIAVPATCLMAWSGHIIPLASLLWPANRDQWWERTVESWRRQRRPWYLVLLAVILVVMAWLVSWAAVQWA